MQGISSSLRTDLKPTSQKLVLLKARHASASLVMPCHMFNEDLSTRTRSCKPCTPEYGSRQGLYQIIFRSATMAMSASLSLSRSLSLCLSAISHVDGKTGKMLLAGRRCKRPVRTSPGRLVFSELFAYFGSF